MAASLTNSNYSNNNKLRENSHGSFDEYTQGSENRSTRAASFGISTNASLFEFLKKTAEPITNKFMLAPPSASTISIRRHSSHNCNANRKNSPMRSSRGIANTNSAASSGTTDIHTNNPIPPSVPKRSFIGKLIIATSFSEAMPASKTSIATACPPQTDDTRKRMVRSIQSRRPNHEMPYQNDQCSDDDRLSLESVFEEPKSSDPIIFSKSNRSSSDSNKSHGTIDTGYMSATNDNDRIFFGPSEDFRTRFSSVDTQSSLDSFTCLSSENQPTQPTFNPNHARCIISPLAMKRDDGDDMGRKYNGRSAPKTATKLGNNLKLGGVGGAVDAPNGRRMTSASNRIQVPPIIPVGNGPSRPRPPPPPMRPQSSLDSGKIFHNGSMLGAFQNGIARITSAASLTSEAVIGRKITNVARQLSAGSITANSNSTSQSPKINHRQDSTISSDSFLMTSSPGFNSKNMEAPLLQNASRTHWKNNTASGNESADSFGMTSRHVHNVRNTLRQDSTVSSDSQTSSPGYTTKLSEQPLLAHALKINAIKQNLKAPDEIHTDIAESNVTSPITKSASTPASLQTIVRFQNGSNMSLQHKVLNRRKSSNPYITRGRLKFRLLQILLNALALLIIAGGLAAYFRAYPTVKIINKTIIAPQRLPPITLFNLSTKPPAIVDKNPAPGVCLPVIVKFCQQPQVPYNYTIYPNYIGHFSQLEAELELDAYDALVDVKCYELVTLFLCSLFVPKCGSTGMVVPPCKYLCEETMRRCKFFLGVFSLELPEYLTCNQFIDSPNSNVCVGYKQIRDAQYRNKKPTCSGFLCDGNRCLPSSYRCDGHVDCSDQTDETRCEPCDNDSIYCGENRCMSSSHVCDGEVNCPFGQDERNCMRLSERNGDLGKGVLEIYKVKMQKWVPACVNHWNPAISPTMVCSMLGYSSVNSSKLTMSDSDVTIYPQFANQDTPAIWRMMQKKRSNLIREFASCPSERHPVVDLTCLNYECGKIKTRRLRQSTRVIGGGESSPGDWPFLAAILGGPEEVFYCAGVLIADQWVLTASHCIGNHSLHKLNDWTIQLGITRRLSHTYYGQRVKIQRVIPHPQYNLDVLHDNDVALFQLSKRVAFHEHLLPVCLPPPGMEELKPGTVCTVIGWGKREDKKASSASYEPTVNEVDVPILHRDLCNEWLVQLNVTDGMICAGYAEGGKDACQGDSGGPLLCMHPNDREKFFVGGIVSWGVKCASPKLPGVYANVPKYIPWILQTMQTYSNMPVNRERNTYGKY